MLPISRRLRSGRRQDANKKILADLARVVADRYGVTLDNSQPAKGPRRYLLLNVHRHENGELDGDLIEEPLEGAAGKFEDMFGSLARS